MAKEYIIAIGASAGGIEAISNLLGNLPADFAAPILITQHISSHISTAHANIFRKASKLPIVNPEDGETIQPGNIYLAKPDKHMTVEDGILRLLHGPKVNHCRPAIDPLFQSVAFTYRSRVIGIILSGLLDDGVAGMVAIKKHGGITIAQDVKEAQFPDMPRNALKYSPIDHCLPTAKIAELLKDLVNKKFPNEVSSDMNKDRDISKPIISIPEDDIAKLGAPSIFTCPDCHGSLWEIREGDSVRFRCRVGHAFGIKTLSERIGESVEDTLWAALRALEEKADLAMRIFERSKQRNKDKENLHVFSEKAKSAKQHAEILREILLTYDREAE